MSKIFINRCILTIILKIVIISDKLLDKFDKV